MNAKAYLRQYADLVRKIERYKERIEGIENVLKGINLDGLPHGSSIGDPTKNAALNLALLEEQLQLAILEAEQTRQEIADNIEQMPTQKYKELLFDRYLLLMRWEDVTDEMNFFRRGKEYEMKHVMGYMHGKALKELREVMQCSSRQS